MLFSMEYYHVFLVMCISLCSSEDDGHKSPPSTGILCKSNEYYSIGLQRCLTCSVCPGKNLIIRKPCEKYSDTQCGPFIEFDKFHQSPIVNVLSSANVTRGKVLLTARIESTRSTNVPVEVIKDGRWYTLAMALVGVLCVVSFFVLLYIVLYCFVCKKRRNEKQLIYDPELHVSSVRSIPLIVRNSSPRTRYSDLPSRERLKKQVVTYTEETEDSSGTVTRVVALPSSYIPIPSGENSTESDSDNSGQTLSSTANNYVYILKGEP